MENGRKKYQEHRVRETLELKVRNVENLGDERGDGETETEEL